MITVNLLEARDTIKRGDYVRYLDHSREDRMLDTNMHGIHVDNPRWHPVEAVLGNVWLKGNTVCARWPCYEFMRPIQPLSSEKIATKENYR